MQPLIDLTPVKQVDYLQYVTMLIWHISVIVCFYFARKYLHQHIRMYM